MYHFLFESRVAHTKSRTRTRPSHDIRLVSGLILSHVRCKDKTKKFDFV